MVFEEDDVVRADGVVKDFRPGFGLKRKRVLHDVTFSVKRGEIFGFVGPNGAGKSTALKLIATMIELQAGTIQVFGRSVDLKPHTIRPLTGYMPDRPCAYQEMTVFEYLDFYGAGYGLNEEERDAAIRHLLELTDMTSRRDYIIRGLSRGMQQRVSLMRVLVYDPDLLLLDEPAAGLDPRARIELMQILRELRSLGKSIIVSSHILTELADLCDTVTVVDRGHIKYTGDLDGLLVRDHENPTFGLRLSERFDDLDLLIGELPGVVWVERVRSSSVYPEYRITIDLDETSTNELLSHVVSLGAPVATFQRSFRHLHQAFLDLTSGGVT